MENPPPPPSSSTTKVSSSSSSLTTTLLDDAMMQYGSINASHTSEETTSCAMSNDELDLVVGTALFIIVLC